MLSSSNLSLRQMCADRPVLSNYSADSYGRFSAWFRAAAAHIVLMVVSGWLHRQQVIVVEHLRAENRLLRERLRRKRIRFHHFERTLLARGKPRN
jgi:hypothetical protein